jgi:predicted nicotinamide N-methyase
VDPDVARRLIRSATECVAPPLVPELLLHLAPDVTELWRRTETALGRTGLAPPFWGFAWAGGQALARYLLDHPATVAGRCVLDAASGSGLVAIAAALAGARAVRAGDVDPLAVAAVALNARRNNVPVTAALGDGLAADGAPAEVVLIADVFYEQPMAGRAAEFVRAAAARGATVLVGDPARSYFPRADFDAVAAYDVPVTRDLEGVEVLRATVWRPRAPAPVA